jgi:altronate dehydratase
MAASAVRALQLDPGDNVAVATVALAAGEQVPLEGATVILVDPIPVGHKLALAAIAAGEQVHKYGEVIGVATQPIAAGAHVHVHNLVSARLPNQGAA